MQVIARSKLLEDVIAVARKAGEAIMQVYAGQIEIATKDDASPVTQADQKAEQVICAALHVLTPDIPVVAEEAFSAGNLWDLADRFWLVDPLDGTREFINRNGEFTVNIALIEGGRPVLGVVYAPALNKLYAGAADVGSFVEEGERREIACRKVPADGLTVVSSRSHGDEQALDRLLAGRKVAVRANAGSSLKLCMVAAGEADLYPRLGRTMEWDIAAGHAIVAAAGGRVTDLAGSELTYSKPGFENPHFLVWGRQQ
ncbi:MAG TPA: 3'(2'),5'-bisphosphate nucleotidase CysQ [Ramlibacter sp.]|nr:3'(2'),5'-bisphosphate nucleotidase CysQ [Ramlibacter sp.]